MHVSHPGGYKVINLPDLQHLPVCLLGILLGKTSVQIFFSIFPFCLLHLHKHCMPIPAVVLMQRSEGSLQSQCHPSTTWVPGIELRPAVLAADTFTH